MSQYEILNELHEMLMVSNVYKGNCWHLGHWVGPNRHPCGQHIKTKP